ncbi:hypothetical protein L4C34_12720 [Vibrio profundum]|uniref:YciI family protein n=1 Tax=Vibrio profundum TaxID=2910247 RepID=UPI003D0EB884
MYTLIVDLIKPVDEVNKLAKEHGVWVKQQVDRGIFLLAGPKRSGLGGVTLTKSMDKGQLKTLLASDPYLIEDVAEYQIIDFDCKLTAHSLSKLQHI